jgi:hypothetical protein
MTIIMYLLTHYNKFLFGMVLLRKRAYGIPEQVLTVFTEPQWNEGRTLGEN